MKILVTGATGFIGKEIINSLRKSDHQIIATARSAEFFFSSDNRVLSKDLDLSAKNFDYFNYLKEPDILIHAAWDGLPNYASSFHIEENFFSNYSFIKRMIKSGLKRVIGIGTCFEYGMKNGCLNESEIVEPYTYYGYSKDFLRKSIMLLKSEFDFDFQWHRLFYPYGERQASHSLYSQLITAINEKREVFNMSAGQQLRDFIHVDVACEYIVKCALQERISGIINICSGVPISVRAFVEHILEQHCSNMELNLGYYNYPSYEPMAYWGDDEKLKKIINK